MKYGFYSKNDKGHEIIKVGDFASLDVATRFFAILKGLKLEEFHRLYNVVAIKKEWTDSNT